jgi:ketosteroid isomerase-like protein
MTTREVITKYYDLLNKRGNWQSFIAEDITFTSVGKITYDKKSYVDATNKFLQVVKSFKINEFIVEGEKACITVEYQLQSPKGNTSSCEVAEVLMARDGKIYSSCIFFDTASFSRFMARG